MTGHAPAAESIFPLLTVFVLLFGACLGSFLNVCIWRLPRGESLVSPGSHCPRCNHAIRPWENIPLLSWLLLRGRCSQCRQPISVRYPLVEGVTAVLVLLVWLRVWNQRLPLVTALPYIYLTGSLIAAALIDVEHLLIPDRITLTGVGAALVFAFGFPETRFSAVAGNAWGPEPALYLQALISVAGAAWPALARQAWFWAGLDALVGAAVGFLMLWVVMEAGKRLWGRRACVTDGPRTVSLTSAEVSVEADLCADWPSVLARKDDRFVADATAVEVSWRDPAGDVQERRFPETRVVVDRESVAVGAETIPLGALCRLQGLTRSWQVPREVMGGGDLKLLAMIGAFLGPEAVVFIVMLSATAGSVAGVLLMARRSRQWHTPVPFGPFLAGATLFWLLAGVEFVRWYGSLLMGTRCLGAD